MTENRFYSYRKKKERSKAHLKTITEDLSRLFDPLEWDRGIHEKKLKAKVINKIHRIRKKLGTNAAVEDLRTALEKLTSKDHDEALQAVFDVVGLEKSRIVLAEMGSI